MDVSASAPGQTILQGGDKVSANIFSSLSGNYDYMSDMSNLLSDYNQIKSGAYGSLMKSYVNKVGNKSALKAYQETGSTTTAANSDSTASISTAKKSSSSKTSFLDSHLSSVKNSGSVPKSDLLKKTDASSDTSTATTTDQYAKYKSSWLDDQLKQYDKDANKTTAADTSVSLDTTV